MKLKLFIMMCLLAFCSSMGAYADSAPSETIPVEKDPEPDVNRRRIPGQKMLCTIDQEEGVTIPGVEKGSILSYEAYDADGGCLASFVDEASFVEFFFSESNGAIVSVRFVTFDCAYRGYLY